MILHEFSIIHERRVLAHLLGDFLMAVHELVEAGELPAGGVAVAIAVTIVLAPIKALFLPHEGVRVFPDLFPNFRMLLQILLQRGMLFDELFVVHQRRIPVNLFGDLGMTIHELIETGQLPTPGVIVPRHCLSIVLRLRRHGLWILGRHILGVCRSTEPEHNYQSQ